MDATTAKKFLKNVAIPLGEVTKKNLSNYWSITAFFYETFKTSSIDNNRNSLTANNEPPADKTLEDALLLFSKRTYITKTKITSQAAITFVMSAFEQNLRRLLVFAISNQSECEDRYLTKFIEYCEASGARITNTKEFIQAEHQEQLAIQLELLDDVLSQFGIINTAAYILTGNPHLYGKEDDLRWLNFGYDDLKQKRNCVVHRDGIIDEGYLKLAWNRADPYGKKAEDQKVKLEVILSTLWLTEEKKMEILDSMNPQLLKGHQIVQSPKEFQNTLFNLIFIELFFTCHIVKTAITEKDSYMDLEDREKSALCSIGWFAKTINELAIAHNPVYKNSARPACIALNNIINSHFNNMLVQDPLISSRIVLINEKVFGVNKPTPFLGKYVFAEPQEALLNGKSLSVQLDDFITEKLEKINRETEKSVSGERLIRQCAYVLALYKKNYSCALEQLKAIKNQKLITSAHELVDSFEFKNYLSHPDLRAFLEGMFKTAETELTSSDDPDTAADMLYHQSSNVIYLPKRARTRTNKSHLEITGPKGL